MGKEGNRDGEKEKRERGDKEEGREGSRHRERGTLILNNTEQLSLVLIIAQIFHIHFHKKIARSKN